MSDPGDKTARRQDRPILFPKGKVSKLDQSRDELLATMATALEMVLRKTSRIWPEDGQADAIADVLKDRRIIFYAARLTGP